MAEKKKAGDAPKKGGALPLLIGAVAAILSGAAGFFLINTGMLSAPLPPRQELFAGGEATEPRDLPDTDFVALTPLIVTLGDGDALRQLQLTAQLEVAPDAVDSVALLTPRVIDVLNTYLRAVDAATVEDPAAMLRMRAQMLLRVQVVTGDGMVRDLLVSEFILR